MRAPCKGRCRSLGWPKSSAAAVKANLLITILLLSLGQIVCAGEWNIPKQFHGYRFKWDIVRDLPPDPWLSEQYLKITEEQLANPRVSQATKKQLEKEKPALAKIATEGQTIHLELTLTVREKELLFEQLWKRDNTLYVYRFDENGGTTTVEKHRRSETLPAGDPGSKETMLGLLKGVPSLFLSQWVENGPSIEEALLENSPLKIEGAFHHTGIIHLDEKRRIKKFSIMDVRGKLVETIEITTQGAEAWAPASIHVATYDRDRKVARKDGYTLRSVEKLKEH